MKTMRHTKRMEQPLHVEAPGCIVNIYAGQQDTDGTPVTTVQILCDTTGTDKWLLENGERFVSLRVIREQPSGPTP